MVQLQEESDNNFHKRSNAASHSLWQYEKTRPAGARSCLSETDWEAHRGTSAGKLPCRRPTRGFSLAFEVRTEEPSWDGSSSRPN